MKQGSPKPQQHLADGPEFWNITHDFKPGELESEMSKMFFNQAIDLHKENEALKERIKQLEAVVNDPNALWANWLRGTVALPAGIGDVRQYQERIRRLEETLNTAWEIIANTSGGEWKQQHPQWQKAAARWRDNEFLPAMLDRKAKEAP